MHLLSCSNPKRVYNKYIQDYIWVPCGECAICKNRRAAHYTELLERERLQHSFAFFVTLTYSDEHIPFISQGFLDEKANTGIYVGSRERDCICIPFSELFPPEKKNEYCKSFESVRFISEVQKDGSFKYSCVPYNIYYDSPDLDFFNGCLAMGGLPYASKTDAQLFLKRLNKYFFDNVTHQYKNFRYFLVSELGSTTFRPHFHAIFFVDNQRCAERFSDGLSACWKYGIIDCKSVESSACGYVAQYINKSADLPYVYKNRQISPFFLCSRNPFIGTLSKRPQDDKEIVMQSAVTTCIRKKASDNKFTAVPLLQSYQNRLFPKCPSFGSISDTLRAQLYTGLGRFNRKSLKGFCASIFRYMMSDVPSELCQFLRDKLVVKSNLAVDMINLVYQHEDLDDRLWRYFDETSFNWIRRLYYFSLKITRQARQLSISTWCYMKRIFEYYSNKELYFINKQYEYQVEVSQLDSDSIAIMYPEYLYQSGIFDIKSYIVEINSDVCLQKIADEEYLFYSNKKTHFKNAYLDSLQYKRESKYRQLFNLIKNYLYAKECNETLEAFAA